MSGVLEPLLEVFQRVSEHKLVNLAKVRTEVSGCLFQEDVANTSMWVYDAQM
jgi:hypothetical protein